MSIRLEVDRSESRMVSVDKMEYQTSISDLAELADERRRKIALLRNESERPPHVLQIFRINEAHDLERAAQDNERAVVALTGLIRNGLTK